MKKTLAIALSLMLVVVLAIGVFVFSSSAAEKSIGETRAEAAWAEANKATSFKIKIAGKEAVVDAAITDKALSEIFKDVAFYEGEAAANSAMELLGKITFANGEVTLDGVAANAQTKDAEGKVTESAASFINIVPNGGLYVTVKGGDFTGGVFLNDLTVGVLPDKSHLIVTSPDGSALLAGANNAFSNTWGHIIIFGNININMTTPGYDAVICRDPKADGDWKNNETVKATTYTQHDIVLDPENETLRFHGGAFGAAVESRCGQIVYGSTDMVVVCTGSVGAPMTTAANMDMVLEGNMKFFIENGHGPAAKAGKLTIKDNVLIYHKGSKIGSWAWTVTASTLDISNVTMIVEWDGFAAAAAAPIQTTGGATAQDTVISGGKFFFDVVGGTAGTRSTGMLFKGDVKVNFNGGDFYINVADTTGNDSDAVIRTQNGTGAPTEINFNGANFKITANENSKLFRIEQNACAINFKSGSFEADIKGYLIDLQATALAVTVNTAAESKVSITSALDSKWKAGASLKINGTDATAATKEVKNGTVIAMTETAPNVIVPVANVKSSDVTATGAKITWDAIKGVKGYKVTVNGADIGVVNTNEAVLEGLPPETACSVVITAIYTDSLTAAADAITVTTLKGEAAGPVVTAPKNLQILGVNDKKAIIGWDAVEGATAYVIYVDGVAIADSEGKPVQHTKTQYVLTGLEKEVEVTISSLSIAGETEKSAGLKVKLAAAGKYPTLVEVTMADGSVAYLSDKLTSVKATTGTVSFDVATGTVTLDGTTGVRGVAANKILTILVKGENTVGVGHSGNIFTADDLIFDGDGKLVVEADTSGYPIFAQSHITFQGDLTVDINGGAKVSSAIHTGRGTNDTRGGTGDTSVTFKGNVKVDLDANAAGVGMNIAGLRVKLIVTDKANVVLSAKSNGVTIQSDAACAGADLTKGASIYVEFSGNSSFTILNGNCGIRAEAKIDASAEAMKPVFDKPVTIDVVCKGNAKVDLTAPGQTLYLTSANAKNDSKAVDVGTIRVSGNASLKVTNPGWPEDQTAKKSYTPIQMNNTENVIDITGGTVELINKSWDSASYKNPDNADKGSSAIIVTSGTNKFSVASNVKSFVGGKDAANTKPMTAINIGNYYMKTTFEIQNTSDVSYTAAIVLLSVAAVAAAAVVVIRKKSYNK